MIAVLALSNFWSFVSAVAHSVLRLSLPVVVFSCGGFMFLFYPDVVWFFLLVAVSIFIFFMQIGGDRVWDLLPLHIFGFVIFDGLWTDTD